MGRDCSIGTVLNGSKAGQIEAIGVKGVRYQIADCSGVLARVSVVRAVAPRPHFACAGQQIEPRASHIVGNLGRQFPVQQRRGPAELGGDRAEHAVPFLLRELPDPNPGVIRLAAAALYPGPCLARRQDQVADRA